MLFVASPLFILLFSLFLIFLSLINVNLGMFLLGFILYGTLSFLVFSECFIFYVRNIFNSNLWKYFLRPFLSLFCFWESCNVNVGSFNVVPEVSETVFISFFFSTLFHDSDCHYSVFQHTYLLFHIFYSATDFF